MKRKKAGSSATTDLRSFLQKSATKKKQFQSDIVIPFTNESQMQLVVFQGQSDRGTSTAPPQAVRDEQRQSNEAPITEDDKPTPPAQSDSSDGDEDNNDDYEIEHDPGLSIPISSYPVNARGSIRRALIAMGPCRPKMKREDFPQHECGGMRPSAYYVHCFAHQLQLTLVAVAKENTDCDWSFIQLSYLLSVLGMSCKKIWMLRVAQAEYMIEALRLGEIETGQGLNQEMGLVRPGDTRWGSHYKTVMHVMYLYPSIRKVLFRIGNESKGAEANGARTMLSVFKSFEFVFLLHLMNEIFGYTNDLCIALQKREQDIVNAMDLLEFTKVELDVLRQDSGWQDFLNKVTSFCEKHNVRVVDMNGKYIPQQRSRQFYRGVINYHRFHADMFLGIIDRQVQELNNRFDEVNTELLRCMASFSPAKSFAAFNAENLIKLAKFYPHDFDVEEMNQLPFQLNRYINEVRNDDNFKNLRSLTELSMMLVEKDKVSRYDIVYNLLKLVLLLPVATTGVERIFSVMNFVKNKLRSKIGHNI